LHGLVWVGPWCCFRLPPSQHPRHGSSRARSRSDLHAIAQNGDPGFALTFQFRLELGRVARKDEAEADPALPALRRVMELVSLYQLLEIAALGNVTEPALVNEAIMHQRVDDPVTKDAQPYPRARPPDVCAHNDRTAESEHRNAERRPDPRDPVVFVEPLVLRLMVSAMPRPAEAVHDVFVAAPGNPFHGQNGCQYNSDGAGQFHGR